MTINSWLMAVVLSVTGFVAFSDASGTYLEHAKGSVYLLLALTFAALLINRYVRDTLLELSNLMFVVFFILRIPFVYADNVLSDVYFRNDDLQLVPHAMLVLCCQFAILCTCLLVFRIPARVRDFRPVTASELRAVLRFSGAVLGMNLVYLIGFWTFGSNSIPSAIAIVLALFNYGSTLFLLAPCLLLLDENIGRRDRLLLFAQLSTVALCVMITGSKSGVFQIILFYLIALLVIRGPGFVISTRATIVASVVGLLASAFFFVGVAFNLYQRGQIDINEISSVVNRLVDDTSLAIAGISTRMGYLDYYIDKMINPVYRSSFSLVAYAKAVVDAITPGFDVFNQPLVSRAVYAAQFGTSEGPNSEVVTVFAEAHLLVGYFSFLIYLPVLWLIRTSARFIRTDFYFAKVLQLMFVAYAFQQYLAGIGLDYWSFGNVLYPLIFLVTSTAYLSRTRVSDHTAIVPLLA